MNVARPAATGASTRQRRRWRTSHKCVFPAVEAEEPGGFIDGAAHIERQHRPTRNAAANFIDGGMVFRKWTARP